MKSICLGLWGRNRKPRRLTNPVAASPHAYNGLRRAWRVYAASAEEARRLIALFEAGRDVGTGPFGRPRVEIIKSDRR